MSYPPAIPILKTSAPVAEQDRNIFWLGGRSIFYALSKRFGKADLYWARAHSETRGFYKYGYYMVLLVPLLFSK